MIFTSAPDRRSRPAAERARSVGVTNVTPADPFWAPRLTQLTEHTLPVLRDRLRHHGVDEAFDRLSLLPRERPARRAPRDSDADLASWIEAASTAGVADLVEPFIEPIVAAQQADGYWSTRCGVDPSGPRRYESVEDGAELRAAGRFFEAAVAHHDATGDLRLLDVAIRWADHLLVTFGPGRDERVPTEAVGLEVALVRLAAATGNDRYVDHARWHCEQRMALAHVDLETLDLTGDATAAALGAEAVAAIASATGFERWRAAAERLFDSLVGAHLHPTGTIGTARSDGTITGAFHVPTHGPHVHSCAAAATLRFAHSVWRLTGRPDALDVVELALYNAVAAGVGSDGESWLAVHSHTDGNHRGSWLEQGCCPTALARAVASVPSLVAEVAADGHLRIHLPITCRVEGGGWDVEVRSNYPWDADVDVITHEAPEDGRIAVRVPAWAGGRGHRDITASPRLRLLVRPEWWEADPRVTAGRGSVFLRRGPIAYCVEGPVDGPDLRSVAVVPGQPMEERDAPILAGGMRVLGLRGRVLPTVAGMYHRLGEAGAALTEVELTAVPVAARANRGLDRCTFFLRT